MKTTKRRRSTPAEAKEYLHGFSRKEQTRLLHQAEFLEPYVYRNVDLEFSKTLLEVGCGVGAQTQILLRRFPKIKITSVDFSDAQLKLAKDILRPAIEKKRVRLVQADAQKLDLNKKDYDNAFLCWFLEHVPDPQKVINSVYKHLRPGGHIHCSEVFNQTLFFEPYSPAFLKYWFEFNDLQSEIKGHPFIGASLGNLLLNGGFKDIETEVRCFHFDSRKPEIRAAFTDYFFDLLISAEGALVKSGRVTKDLIMEMRREFDVVKKSKDAVFFYADVRAKATKP